MKYSGKLYGKIGRRYIELAHTSQDVAELTLDKARIDWLASPTNEIGQVSLPTAAVLANPDSLRDAIDAAISGDYPDS